MNHPLSDMMTNTMSKIKDMIDVNTVVGSPITTPDGVTIELLPDLLEKGEAYFAEKKAAKEAEKAEEA